MRSFLFLSFSAVALTGCLTSQENPNYQYSTTYRGDVPTQTQYASSSQITSAQPVASISYDSPEAQRILAQTGSTDPALMTSMRSTDMSYLNNRIQAAPTTVISAGTVAPTDSVYANQDVTGTPGFMALQSAQQTAAATPTLTLQAAAPVMPAGQYMQTGPQGTAGTPIAYDYSRNIVFADANTAVQRLPNVVRVQQGAGQAYTVQQGDTVYGLSRRTCVGVSVIQSMNGLSPDFAIQIGQSLNLPASIC